MKRLVFDHKMFNELWEHFDVEDKADLLVNKCGFNERQRQAILLINDSLIHESSSKTAIDLLNFNDHRSFARYRAKTIKRILNVLNSPKHNSYYSNFLK